MKRTATERVMRRAAGAESAFWSIGAAPARSTGPDLAELAQAKTLARRAAELAMSRAAAARSAPRAEAIAEQDHVGRFLAWAARAEPQERASVARALGRAYVRSIPPAHWRHGARPTIVAKLNALRRDAEICLTMLVDDESTAVRRALAETLGREEHAPRHIIIALAADCPEVAAVIAARSPVLSDFELVELAASASSRLQAIIARRPGLSADVAAALAATDRSEVVMALLENPTAHLDAATLRRIAQRFREYPEARAALLARSALPATLRYDLVEDAARFLPPRGRFGVAHGPPDSLALERYAVRLASSCAPEEARALMRHLRAKGVLTAAILMRALVSGARSFFIGAASELTAVDAERVAGFMREPFGPGFAALHRRMRLPAKFLPPFRAAAAALDEFGVDHADGVLAPIVSRAIAACGSEPAKGLARLVVLLRRLETEAALDEARQIAKRAAAGNLAARRGEMGAAGAIAFDPRLARLLSVLGRLEAEPAFAEAVSLEARREIMAGLIAPIAAIFGYVALAA